MKARMMEEIKAKREVRKAQQLFGDETITLTIKTLFVIFKTS